MNGSTREILDALTDTLAESATRIETAGGRDRLWLPKPTAADYGLYIDTQQGGGGLLIGALPTGAPANTFFWHLPFGYSPEHEAEVLRVLIEEARRLIMNRSRIRQSLGFLLCRLRCEVEESGQWKRLGGTIASTRLFFMPPFAFRLKTWEYHSAPLQRGTEGGRPTSG